MARVYILIWVVSLALCIYCVIEIIQTKEEDTRYLPKLVWLVFVLFFQLIGSIAWLAVGSPRNTRPRAYERAVPQFPEYDRPGRAAGATPESDEEFLKRVRERAEEQRRRAAEQKKREQEGPGGDAGEATQPPAVS